MPTEKVPFESLVSVDPGNVHTGLVSLFNGEFSVSQTCDDFWDTVAWLETALMLKPDIVVVEKFQMYPNRAHAQAWSSFEAVRIIGIIEYLAQRYDVQFKQAAPPDINAFWKVRKIPANIKSQLGSAHEISAYRIAMWCQTMYRVDPKVSGAGSL